MWIELALAGTFFWACTNIMDKILKTRYIDSAVSLSASFGIFGMLFSAIIFLSTGAPSIPFQNALAAFGAGVLVPYIVIPYLKALSLEEASRVIPLWSLAPAFTLLLAVIFLGEVLPGIRYAAFALMLAGGFLISTRKIGSVLHVSPAAMLMLLSSALIAVADTMMKFAFYSGDFWGTFLIFYFAVNLSQLSLFLSSKTRKKFLRAAKKRNFIVLVFASTVFASLGHIVYNNAILLGPVTLVSVLGGFQSVFVLAIATALSHKFPSILKEEISAGAFGRKIASIALMMAGLYLLTM